MILICLCIVALANQYIANCEIIRYRDHLVLPNRPEYLIIPKFDKTEVPNWYPGHGRSFIDLSDVMIHSSCDPVEISKRPALSPPPPGMDGACEDAIFEVLMFEAPKNKPWMDYWVEGEYCCTDSVVQSGGCASNMVNRLIVPDHLPGAFLRATVVKTDEGTSLVLPDEVSRHDITSSGIYVLLMALCDSSAMPVVIDGAIESVDPYGYVPADQFGNMPFNMALSLMYLAVALAWGILCFWYSDQLMPLQLWISAVLIIAMIETALLYVHFIDWNESGEPTTFITVIAVLFGALKRSISRILVQLVALGYGVVRPSLGEDMHRVLYLGGGYFILSFVYSLLVNLAPTTKSVVDSDYDALSLIVFLLAVVDTTFYIWIFTSINNLMISLASRRQGVKYTLYKRFRTVLCVLLVFTTAWVMYSSVMFINDSGGTNNNWRMKWTVDSLWELIYFIIFVAIAVLWAPSNNSQRYAYSVELTQLEDDGEWNSADDAAASMAAAAVGGHSAGDNKGGASSNSDDHDGDIDNEYGGRLHDEKDPFQGTGALDPSMAAAKKA